MKLRPFISQFPCWLRWTLPCSIALLAGCSRDEIKVYQIAKETPPQTKTTQAPHDHDHDHGNTSMPKLEWTLPEGWEETAAGEMRLASFRIKGQGSDLADVGVFPLPGLAGGDLGNVNRWRSQVGLPAIEESELSKLAEPVQIAGQSGTLYEMSGENPTSGDKTRILGAIQHRDGVAWFFKVTGADALVASHKKSFVDFLSSLRFTTANATLPPDHPPVDNQSVAAQVASTSSGEGKPAWTVPAGWREVSGGPFLISKFQITGEKDAQASVNVSMSAGSGGGVFANINRWRKQVGLDELPEADLKNQITEVKTTAGNALMIEMTGKDPRTSTPTAVIGAILELQGRTWFYKLSGSDTLVAGQKQAFIEFIKTAKYPNAS